MTSAHAEHAEVKRARGGGVSDTGESSGGDSDESVESARKQLRVTTVSVVDPPPPVTAPGVARADDAPHQARRRAQLQRDATSAALNERIPKLWIDPESAEHRGAEDAPERPQRLAQLFDKMPRRFSMRPEEPPEEAAATVRLLRTVHSEAYIERVRALSESLAGAGKAGAPHGGLAYLDDGDTYVNEHTYRVASRAAKLCALAVDRMLINETRSAFVACRPPGHHASRDAGAGFCVFNNVAVGAQRILSQVSVSLPTGGRRASRVAIIDVDYHYGDGTASIFRDSPNVFYASVHRFGVYPYPKGTRPHDRFMYAHAPNQLVVPWGVAPGAQFADAHSGVERLDDAAFRDIIDYALMPAVARFAPDFVLISIGFDAAHGDDLTHSQRTGGAMTPAGYVHVVDRMLTLMGERHVVAVLEGGYSERVIFAGVTECIARMKRASAAPLTLPDLLADAAFAATWFAPRPAPGSDSAGPGGVARPERTEQRPAAPAQSGGVDYALILKFERTRLDRVHSVRIAERHLRAETAVGTAEEATRTQLLVNASTGQLRAFLAEYAALQFPRTRARNNTFYAELQRRLADPNLFGVAMWRARALVELRYLIETYSALAGDAPLPPP